MFQWHQHLYVRIWLAVVVALAVLALLLGWLWRSQVEQERAQHAGREIVLRNDAGDVVGRAPARPVRVPGQGLEFQVAMQDGHSLYIQLPRPPRPPGQPPFLPVWFQTVGGFATLLMVAAMAVALGAYPVVRRLTQRLEALQRGVEQWGDGDLSTRLPVQGSDEVAFLAQRFNDAAQRVQSLLLANKSLLANASHELRSPLARIRMGLELLGQDEGTLAQRREMARNIAELDELVDEILLASRLDMTDPTQTEALGPLEEVDLLGLAAEECARSGATLELPDQPPPTLVTGSHRLLRRMLRNLLENARRYGLLNDDPASISLLLRECSQPAGVELLVCDHGPGVHAALRERIFEPFYRLPGSSERDGGVGLGLALVKSIAERHNGTVRCEDRAGGGACFVVWLPMQSFHIP